MYCPVGCCCCCRRRECRLFAKLTKCCAIATVRSSLFRSLLPSLPPPLSTSLGVSAEQFLFLFRIRKQHCSVHECIIACTSRSTLLTSPPVRQPARTWTNQTHISKRFFSVDLVTRFFSSVFVSLANLWLCVCVWQAGLCEQRPRTSQSGMSTKSMNNVMACARVSARTRKC